MSTENAVLATSFVFTAAGTAGLEGLRGMALKEGLGINSELHKMLLGLELVAGGITLGLLIIGLYKFRDARKKG